MTLRLAPKRGACSNPFFLLFSSFWIFQPLVLSSLLALVVAAEDVEAEALGVEHEAVAAAGLLHLGGDGAGVLDLLELDVGAVLLDGVADQLGRARLSLRLDHHGLLLLPRLVHHERCPLRRLLRNLLRLDRRRELGGEGEVLEGVGNMGLALIP